MAEYAADRKAFVVSQELEPALAAARGGDSTAFSSLFEPYRKELITHCYRMLGSLQDAEDQVQETFLRAWKRFETYAGRGSFRAWLYKIATNACLDVLARRPKRTLPVEKVAPADPSAPLPPPILEPVWIEPFPDEWMAPTEAAPEARYEALESISLAFMTALQVLPGRQRSVLILGDVLGFSTGEIAEILGITGSAVSSLLHRARLSLKENYASTRKTPRSLDPKDIRVKELLERYLRAWESADVEAIITMLKDDATFPMPPMPSWFRGREAIRGFIAATILAGNARARWKLLPVRANGRFGFAFYRLDANSRKYIPYAIQVLSFAGDLLADVTTFGFPALFPKFGLPAYVEP